MGTMLPGVTIRYGSSLGSGFLKLTIYLLLTVLPNNRATHQIHMDTHTILQVSLLKSPQPLNGVQFKGTKTLREREKEFELFDAARSGG